MNDSPDPKTAKRERVTKAAVSWVYDQTCAASLLELEEAVTDLIGAPLDPKLQRPIVA